MARLQTQRRYQLTFTNCLTQDCFLLFILDFGESSRKGLFAYAYEHPAQCGKYPSMEEWLTSIGMSGLIPNFLDAGYLTIEPLLMQIELDEMRVDEDFLEHELDINKGESRKALLVELGRGIYPHYSTSHLNNL